MRRTLALCAAIALLRAAPAAAGPMDLDLERIGAPSVPGAVARYRSTVLQLGLGLDSFLLAAPATGGASSFDVALEGAVTPVQGGVLPARSVDPTQLRLFGVHVRKPLPHSLELGARAVYVDQSEMVALQAEARWVVNESWWLLPDLALRAAYTRLLGQRDLDLHLFDLDVTLGKRFGLAGIALTPYAVGRVTALAARTGLIDFSSTAACGVAPGGCFPDNRPSTDPSLGAPGVAAFPAMRFQDHRVVRWALGLQLDAASFSAAAEGTFQDIKTFNSRPGLELVKIPRALTAALRLALHF